MLVPYSQAFETHRNDRGRVQKWVELFINAIQKSNRDTFLDCGCGVGRFTIPMSEYFTETYGVDKNDAMLNVARGKESCVKWICAEAGNIPLQDGAVDTILASMLIEHLPSLEIFLFEAARLLKTQGDLLIRTMLPGDIESTTWYSFSEKARVLETKRTPVLEDLLNKCQKAGFVFCSEHSHLHVIEEIYAANLVDRLQAKSYEILHHLDENDLDQLLYEAQKWSRVRAEPEKMSSSLLVFRKAKCER